MVSPSGVIDEYSSGIAYYKWLKELDDHFNFDDLKQKLESVYQNICFYNRLTLSFTGNNDTNLERQVSYLKETLKVSGTLEKAMINDEEARQEQLEAILNVDKDELLEIAKEIDETLEKGGICIIGGKNQIDQCDLDEVISL